eukprot:TRINITY_DN2946_c0_g1_i2.p1 TRINITY_DN2946_c0_g1~~TRINITY_DN2946_c0_g1_i2.p1  ORF type:complete len:64 (+),score=5.08 TRINITY_DN2946_c0_g1_i2:200-391(+)
MPRLFVTLTKICARVCFYVVLGGSCLLLRNGKDNFGIKRRGIFLIAGEKTLWESVVLRSIAWD